MVSIAAVEPIVNALAIPESPITQGPIFRFHTARSARFTADRGFRKIVSLIFHKKDRIVNLLALKRRQHINGPSGTLRVYLIHRADNEAFVGGRAEGEGDIEHWRMAIESRSTVGI
jgi:hypothetical protein